MSYNRLDLRVDLRSYLGEGINISKTVVIQGTSTILTLEAKNGQQLFSDGSLQWTLGNGSPQRVVPTNEEVSVSYYRSKGFIGRP